MEPRNTLLCVDIRPELSGPVDLGPDKDLEVIFGSGRSHGTRERASFFSSIVHSVPGRCFVSIGCANVCGTLLGAAKQNNNNLVQKQAVEQNGFQSTAGFLNMAESN